MVHGKLRPAELTPHHAAQLLATWRTKYTPGTLYARRQALVRLLRWLSTLYDAQPGLDTLVPTVPSPPIRQTCATAEERARLLAATHTGMRLFIHLCADLGLRHQTALALTYGGWDRQTATLTFATKGGVQQTLPVTNEVAAILAWLPEDTPPGQSVVAAVWPHPLPKGESARRRYAENEWLRLKFILGIRAELHIHDLRRHAAESLWAVTHDLRKVQAFLGHRSPTATARYLANRITAEELAPDLTRAVRQKQRLIERTNPPQRGATQ